MTISQFLVIFLTVMYLCKSQKVDQDDLTTSEWSVLSPDGQSKSGHCLIASGKFSLVVEVSTSENTTLVEDREGVQLVNRTWVVPESASAKGVCGEDSSEINLHWPDPDTGEENLLNFVVSRRGRLAALTGIFTRLNYGSSKIEMYGQIRFRDYLALIWPIRYGLCCKKILQFPLYPAPLSLLTSVPGLVSEHVPKPIGFLVVESINLEGFRADTLVDQYPKSMAQEFYRRKWECEFHRFFKWSTVAVGGGLACLVGFMFGAFVCKLSLGCGDGKRTEYEKL